MAIHELPEFHEGGIVPKGSIPILTHDAPFSKELIQKLLKGTKPMFTNKIIIFGPQKKCNCGMDCNQLFQDIKEGKR